MRFPCASLNIVVDRSLCSDSCPHRQIMWPNEFWSGRENASIRAPPPSFPSLPTPPLWLTSLFVGYTRTVERRGFVFCSGKILTYIARRGSTSFRRGTIGSASPSGKLDPRAGGREVRIGSAFRLNVRRQVYLSRYWDRFSDFGFGFSMLGFNLVGIWLTSNDDLFSFFFFLNIEALFIERIKFVIFVSKMQFLRLMVWMKNSCLASTWFVRFQV